MRPRTCWRSRSCSQSSSKAAGAELNARNRKNLQQTNEELQEKATAARGTKEEVENEEPRGRTGQARPGRKGRAAGPDLEVQIRVPGQHVPRAAHAAQQPADPARTCSRKTRTATYAPSRSSSPRPSIRRAAICCLINDILDLSKIESGTVTCRSRRSAAYATCAIYVERDVPPRGRRQGPGVQDRARQQASRQCHTTIRSGLQQVSRICCPTPSSSPRTARSRSMLRRAYGGWSAEQ